jgi:hypothetical protein
MLKQHRIEFPAEQANDYQANLTVTRETNNGSIYAICWSAGKSYIAEHLLRIVVCFGVPEAPASHPAGTKYQCNNVDTVHLHNTAAINDT